MGLAIGIDLGTTNCCVYLVDGGEPRAVLNAQGGRTTPSVVAFTDRGVLVGAVAQRQAATNPARTVHGIKRLMGGKFDAPEVAAARRSLPYETVAAANGDAWVRIDGEPKSPQEISSLLLAELKRMAEDRLGQPIDEAVVTVPAFFNDSQRQATRDAGALAGLTVRRLLNEPTAAALAYGFDKTAEQTIAVCDLGGGTFDVSILDLSAGVFEVLATSGDRFLGGDDFDRRLCDILLAELRRQEGLDASADRGALMRIREAAQAAKHDLSQAAATHVHLPFLAAREGRAVHLEREFSREELEREVQPELARLEAPCRVALSDAGLRPEDIDSVILVGGMTRMPAVERRIADIFGQKPVKDINPDEVVAMGAALQASLLRGELDDVVLLDVTPHSLGLRVKGGRFSKVMSRNARIPCRETKLFQPVEKGQQFVELEVFQGESELVKDNAFIGRFTLTELPQPKYGGVQVAVSFEMDSDGILRVCAEEPTTHRKASVRLQPSSGLTGSQMERIRERHAGAALPPLDDSGDDASAVRAKVAVVSPIPVDRTQPGSPLTAPKDARGAPPPSAIAQQPAEARAPRSSRISAMALPELPESAAPSADKPLTALTDLIGTTIADRYVIDALLGQGGMGLVFTAHHRVLSRRFAVKVLHAYLAKSEGAAARFMLEAQAASQIRHPNVVEITDFGELADGTAYFVMEYLDGVSLERLLSDGPLSVADTCEIGRQVADGLGAAHELGIVHRDLKPDNVLLVGEQGVRRCKVLDFGIAKSASGVKLTHAGQLIGTPIYMSPEQAQGLEVDRRSDIYALGVMLYEMLCGRPPFEGDTPLSVLRGHVHQTPQPVRALAPSCPIELEWLVHQCLEKLPDSRCQSMAEVSRELGRIATASSPAP